MNRTIQKTIALLLFFALPTVGLTQGSAAGGTLRYGAAYDHGTLDPQLLFAVGDKQMANNVFEGLVRYKLGTTEIEPSLATSWERNEDGTVWTFQLREDVLFHKGYGELSADDVVFTFERMDDPELNAPNAALLDSVTKVVATGSHEVRFELAEPDPAFLDKLANWYTYIVSEKAVLEKADSFGDDPIGTGPYQFTEWLPQQRTVFVAFDEYWGGTPGLERVEFISIPDPTTMYNAFEAGDVDIIFVTDPDKLARYQEDERVEINAVPGLITRFFGMNSDFEPFSDPLVREALTYAIDRQGMIEFLFKGMSTPADSILAPGVQHVKRGVVSYEYDPERARAMLEEAGYPDGFSFTFMVPNIDRFTGPATVIQANLQQVGVDVEIEVLEVQAYVAGLQSDEGFDMFILTRTQDATPDRTLYTWHHSSQIPAGNWARIEDPEVDAWLDEALTTVDEGLRRELFGKVQERVAEGNFYYYIDHENMVFAYHDRVDGFVGDPIRSFRLDNVTVGD